VEEGYREKNPQKRGDISSRGEVKTGQEDEIEGERLHERGETRLDVKGGK
jgi:hypothetical protein